MMKTFPLENDFINCFLFLPRQAKCTHPLWINSEDAQLCCSYVENSPERKTIVHFHGNGETVSDFEDFHIIYDNLGLNSLLAEYRGYGESTGTPGLGAVLRDVDPILRAIPEASKGIILHGRSFGTIPAILGAVADSRVCGLILEIGIAELSSFGLFTGLPNLIGINENEVNL